MSTKTGVHEGLHIEPIDNADDIIQAFDCVCQAFGRQVQDGIFKILYPEWETPEGRMRGAARMVNRWQRTTTNSSGNPNTVFLKATLPCAETPDKRIIAGFAIWVQASNGEGHGDPVTKKEDLATALNLEDLFPGNEPEQRYICQTLSSLHKYRTEVVKEKATAVPPAVMILDMCAVDPAHQRKGIAGALVQWGLDEAQRRGNLELITEGSAMGRHVYGKMGFKPQSEIEYSVDPEFLARSRPSNVFMRTGESS
ncbi:hypothetical protein N7478_012259 [Penicillium angulare]|uniref:uncharacterized protein n=1 Tax=Penicillium angulare TaxID=116970 RepID=UPI00253F9729|nr:uncharacterized protein N7478_012259 [Penicillium angulare]KAJ5259278.1 hypothetical protein N7478_012259 [Penicillium angulare]